MGTVEETNSAHNQESKDVGTESVQHADAPNVEESRVVQVNGSKEKESGEINGFEPVAEEYNAIEPVASPVVPAEEAVENEKETCEGPEVNGEGNVREMGEIEKEAETPDSFDKEVSSEVEEDGFDEDDDDFGSFDEASFEEVLEPEPELELDAAFSSAVLADFVQFNKNLDELLDKIIPPIDNELGTGSGDLLTERASEKLKMFSTLPRLNPPNWTRLKMRHGLLVSLGVPINLDELDSHIVPASKPYSKRRSITELDIKWGEFVVPDIETLSLSVDRQQELMTQTLPILSKIENDNLTNTTEQFLQLSAMAIVDEKLLQMQRNYSQLVELSSVWQAQLKELKNSQEMFESVVQDMVGYRQKLQRNEILESISKNKRGKRVF